MWKRIWEKLDAKKKGHLKEHMKSHYQLECKKCNRKFRSMEKLNNRVSRMHAYIKTNNIGFMMEDISIFYEFSISMNEIITSCYLLIFWRQLTILHLDTQNLPLMSSIKIQRGRAEMNEFLLKSQIRWQIPSFW